MMSTKTAFTLVATAVTFAVSCSGGRESPPAQTAAPPAAESSRQPAAPANAPQWPRASSIDTAARSALPSTAMGRLQESPVPVLVPSDREILRRSQATVLSDKYTFTSKAPDMTVSIQASPATTARRSERAIQPLPRTRVGGREVFFTENEAIRVATWKENGVAYSAEIECTRADDPRCRDNTYLQSIIEKLVFVGGRGARVP